MSNSPRISSCLLVGLALYWFSANWFWAPSASQGGEGGELGMGRGGFLLQRQRGVKRPPLRGPWVGLRVAHAGTLCLVVWLLCRGGPTTRGAPKNHPGAWRLVLRAGKLLPLLGNPPSNSMAPHSHPPWWHGRLLAGEPQGGVAAELGHRPSQSLQHNIDPKSFLPSSPAKQTGGIGIGSVSPRNRTTRNPAVTLATAERSGLQIPATWTWPWSSVAFHATHPSLRHPNLSKEK